MNYKDLIRVMANLNAQRAKLENELEKKKLDILLNVVVHWDNESLYLKLKKLGLPSRILVGDDIPDKVVTQLSYFQVVHRNGDLHRHSIMFSWVNPPTYSAMINIRNSFIFET